MSRRPLAAAAALAVLGASGFAATASGQATPRTLAFTAKAPAKHDTAQVDVKPHGLSGGDEFLVAQTLRAGGHVAGRLHVACTVIDVSYRGEDCRLVLILRGGQLTAAGGGLDRALRGVGDGTPGAGDDFAITGGTGDYAGAGGTVNVRGGDRVTVSLTG